MSVMSKAPKSVSQITKGLQKMIDDLSVSEAQYQEKERQNSEKISQLTVENQDIQTELKRNSSVAGKLKELLGYGDSNGTTES